MSNDKMAVLWKYVNEGSRYEKGQQSACIKVIVYTCIGLVCFIIGLGADGYRLSVLIAYTLSRLSRFFPRPVHRPSP